MSTSVRVQVIRAGWHCDGYPKACQTLHSSRETADKCARTGRKPHPKQVDYDYRVRVWLEVRKFTLAAKIVGRSVERMRGVVYRYMRRGQERMKLDGISSQHPPGSWEAVREACEYYLQSRSA